MSIYAISDLHLSLGVQNKPMNIFGEKWDNYEERLYQNWKKIIKSDDAIILSGDFSWATYLEETKQDFEYLEKLPGTKYLLKGNHDYWWTTLKKMNNFLEENNYKSIKLIYNNSYDLGEYLLTGTRYWDYDKDTIDNEKIYNREIIRAKISLDDAISNSPNKKIIFTTHYPPDEKIINSLKSYNIKIWLYGHIHTNYEENIVKIPEISTYMTSADYLNFIPIKIG